MSDSPSSAPIKKARSQFSLNASSLLQIILFLIAVIAANYLSCQRYSRADLTETTTYSLSTQTDRVLEHPLVANREEPIKIISAFRRAHPFSSRLKTVLEEYRRKGNGKIEIEFIDPIRNPDRAGALSNIYRIEFTKDLVIIDARTKDQPIFTEVPTELDDDAPLQVVPEEKTQLQLSSHVRFLEPEDLALFSVNSATGRDLEGYQDEDAITSAILSSVEGKVRRIYLMADKSDAQRGGKDSPWQVLASSLYHQNIALIPVNMSSLTEIPEDADGVAIIAPKYDLDQRELALLTNYWEKPRAALLVMLSPGSRPDNLRTFLRSHGVTPRDDRILAQIQGETVSTVRATFTPGSEINVELAGKSTSFDGSSSSLDVRENASDLASKRIIPLALIQANEQFYGETNYEAESPSYDPTADIAPPIYMAAAVIRGNSNDDKLAEEIGKMVIVSTTDFLNPDRIREENLNFVNASANWLLGREDLIGIAPKQLATRRMTFLSSEVSFINRVSLILMPLIALVIGAFVWNLRRR